MTEEIQEKKEPIEEKRTLNSYIIEYVVVFLLVSLTCVGLGFLDVYSRGVDYETKTMMVYADALGAGGAFCLCFWALLWVSSEGAFDMIVYGVRKLFNVVFQGHAAKSNLPKTYYDYVTERRGKKKNRLYSLLFISLVYFIIGLVLSILSIT